MKLEKRTGVSDLEPNEPQWDHPGINMKGAKIKCSDQVTYF